MPRVLVVNTGSSSIKYQLVEMPEGSGEPHERGGLRPPRAPQPGGPVDRGRAVVAAGLLERIGEAGSGVADHADGFDRVFRALGADGGSIGDLAGIGHRVVHGGDRLTAPTLLDDQAIAAIDALAPLAPLHNPSNLLGIRIAMGRFPRTPQVAVFDTAFHQTMPPRAWRYALPAELAGRLRIRRYGFHGTSHAYVSRRAAEHLGRPAAELHLITLHLGNGASVAAVAGGRCVDTSMGMTPLEGLVMGTRSGDLDPAVVFYLHREAGLSVDDIDDLLNKRSGMLGLAGANDMREVERRAAAGDRAAAEALDVYCYRIRKYVGAYAAALGRLDALVFTAGVGENSAGVRAGVCQGLEGLGITLDRDRNRMGSGGPRTVSADGGAVAVLVVPTNEELEIAEQTLAVVRGG
jgi:acetate kinase